jgi:hypothetical protein
VRTFGLFVRLMSACTPFSATRNEHKAADPRSVTLCLPPRTPCSAFRPQPQMNTEAAEVSTERQKETWSAFESKSSSRDSVPTSANSVFRLSAATASSVPPSANSVFCLSPPTACRMRAEDLRSQACPDPRRSRVAHSAGAGRRGRSTCSHADGRLYESLKRPTDAPLTRTPKVSPRAVRRRNAARAQSRG